MTRLKSEDIASLVAELDCYDERIKQITGYGLAEVARRAAGVEASFQLSELQSMEVAVIPITSGQGIISGFAESVGAIVRFVGLGGYVTSKPDVQGLAEAYGRRATLVMMADDETFIAINTKTRRVVDNSSATGHAFAYVLHLLLGGKKDESCLVLGCGPVGISGAKMLARLGYEVALCDINPGRAREIGRRLQQMFSTPIRLEPDPKEAVPKYRAILDATPAAAIIDADDLLPGAAVSAPGVPHGLTRRALTKVGDRFFHDRLQLGVATMVFGALRESSFPALEAEW